MRYVRTSLATGAFVAALLHTLPTLDAQSAVVYHDFAKPSDDNYAVYTNTHSLIGQTSSVILADGPAAFKQTAHYHDQEQLAFALAGKLEYSVGGSPHTLDTQRMVLPPSNVPHAMTNTSATDTFTVFEFQPVLRREWAPPHPPAAPAPRSAQPMAVAQGTAVTVDYTLASPDWTAALNGARSKVFSGKQIRATFWDLSAANASVDVTSTASPRERFVLVIKGQLASSLGTDRREIGERMLIEVLPGANGLTLRSLGRGPAEVVVFESLLPAQ